MSFMLGVFLRRARANPLTGETGRGASFTWNRTLYPSHALSLDSAGKVLLVASSETASRTMRLEVNPMDGKLIGTGQILHEFPQHVPPVSAFGEVSFVRENATGQVVGIDRTHQLPSGAVLAIGGMFR